MQGWDADELMSPYQSLVQRWNSHGSSSRSADSVDVGYA